MMYTERKTVADVDFNQKVIKLMKTNPVYIEKPMKFDDMQGLYKAVWFVLHSPKLCGVTFRTTFYGNTIASMVRYCEMQGIVLDLIVPRSKLHTSREFLVWYQEQQTAQEEHVLSIENTNLIIEHAPELIRYAKKSSDELIRVLREQIQKSGYDVSMYSTITTDGLNSGVVEDGKGRHEWSRSYTKHYERYDQTLKDLLLMYISCKFYRSAGFAPDAGVEEISVPQEQADAQKFYELARERGYHVSLDAAKAYTAAYNSDLHDDEVIVVPRSACGLGVQNLMN